MFLSFQLTTDHDTTKSAVKDSDKFEKSIVTNSTLAGLVTNISLGRGVGLLYYLEGVPFYVYPKTNGLQEIIKLRNHLIDLENVKYQKVVVSERFENSQVALQIKEKLKGDFFVGLLSVDDGWNKNNVAMVPTNTFQPNELNSIKTLEGVKWVIPASSYDELSNKYTKEFLDHTIKSLFISEYDPLPKAELPSPPSYRSTLRKILMPKVKNKSVEYTSRLEEELKIIEENGFENIFMIVADYVEYAKINGIEVGAGRGSVSNSLVSYLLGISELDPLEFNLPFERFLNPERISLPDIDIDFESKNIDKVKEYISLTYGSNNVAQLRTYNRLTAKAVLRHVANHYGIDNKLINTMSQLIKSGESLKEATSRSRMLREFFLNNLDVANMCADLENVRRSISVHPAGILIDNEDLREKLPLAEKRNDIWVSDLEEAEVSKLGYLKFDLLSLSNLDFLKELRLVTGLEYEDIPIDDPETFKLFGRGETLGVFQFESEGMVKTLRDTSPKNLVELAVSNALYRPGPLKYANHYILNKNNGFYYSKEINEILQETHGIIIFQEQFNAVISLLKGVSVGEADNFRRYVSKANEKKVKSAFRELYEETLSIDIQNRNFFFSMLYDMKDYSFPKGHSLSYALISYRMAYYKVHFPAVFTVTFIKHKKDNVEEIIEYAKSKGVTIHSPNIHKGIHTQVTSEDIFLGIEFLRLTKKQEVIDLYQKTKEHSWDNERLLLEHCLVLDKKDLETLVFADYFDTEKVDNKKTFMKTISKYKDEITRNNFTGDEYEYFGIPPLMVSEEDYSEETLIRKSYESLGVYKDVKLIDFLAEDIEYTDIKDLDAGGMFTVFGVIDRLRIITDKNGKEMVFLTVEDNTGRLDVVVFSNTLELFRNEMAKDFYVRITGRTNVRNNRIQMIAEEIKRK